MNIKVSVIVPVYNMEKYLKQCLDSLIAQTYPNIEILVIDDGSTDQSPMMCDEYATNERVKVYHKTNGGLCSARNYGLERAEGEWVLFVDSDDWCDVTYVEKLVSAISGDDIDVVFSSAYAQGMDMEFTLMHCVFGEPGIYQEPYEIEIAQALSFGSWSFYHKVWNDKVVVAGDNVAPWNKLYKMSVIRSNDLKYDENTRVLEDIMFNMDYMEFVKKISYVDARGYYYRYVESGITKFIRSDRLQKEGPFLDKAYNYLESHKDNKYVELGGIQRACALAGRLGRYVVCVKKELSWKCVKENIIHYLEHPFFQKVFSYISYSDVPGMKNKMILFCARHRLIYMLYILRQANLFRN